MEENSRFLLFFPFIFLLSLPTFSAQSQTQEQTILLDLKSHWGNPSSLSAWMADTSTTSHCDWNGVVCTDNFVTNITLRDDITIAGEVPTFVCNLTHLSTLDLHNDAINGTFPDLSVCRNLTHLDLGQNYLAGNLPSDVGTALSNKLVYLDVGYNVLTGDVPKSIGELSSPRLLNLEGNLLDGTVPAEIGGVEALEILTFAFNPLAPAEIPAEFGGLKNLRYLLMRNASLVGGIPDSFGNLSGLEYLDLAVNNLTGAIPPGIWGLENLTTLYLFDNKLTGGFPDEIGAKKLADVDVSSNQLNGSIPEDFGELNNLESLNMYFNQLSGEIPSAIGKIPTLRNIKLFRNRLTGSLPSELGKHSKLYNFEVSENQLTGELPDHLCDAQILNSLIVFGNGFSGEIAESLGNCSSLVNIQLYDNDFHGEIPSGMWSLKELNVVRMQNNQLSGELPAELPENLERLEIGHNRLYGNIPTKGKNLTVFYGGNNGFTGELPSDMSGLTGLQQLLLDDNKLTGAIPTTIGKLYNLTQLNLRNNRLTGEIPASIGSMPVLTSLDLSENHLSGAIPASLSNLRLSSLNLSSNSLTGEVPSELENGAFNDSFLFNPALCSSVVSNLPTCHSTTSSAISTRLLAVFLSLGVVIFLAGVVYCLFAVRQYRKRRERSDEIDKNSKLTSFHKVDFTETSILDGIVPMNLIGTGGSGQVYAISLGENSGKVVAVKKLRSNRKHDRRIEKEFNSEVEILGSIRHLNVVKLLCCVSSPESKLLVYEYMENGSLDQWLHGRRRTTSADHRGLDWPTRMAIAVGAARGLCYMHHDCNPPIIHRDVKSSNILLDSDFNPKVADFGLARILSASGEADSTVSAMAGSFGYMAPECAYSKRVNEKIDVYSFGVVLLELTTGREANDGGPYGCLSEWAWKHFQDGGSWMDIVDKDIRDTVEMKEINMVIKLGLICTGRLPSTRPTMKDLVRVLLGGSGDDGVPGGKSGGGDSTKNVPFVKKGSGRWKKGVGEEDDKSGLLSNV